MGSSIIAVFALSSFLWGISGVGRDTVFWGFVLMLAWLPFYGWQARGVRNAKGLGKWIGKMRLVDLEAKRKSDR